MRSIRCLIDLLNTSKSVPIGLPIISCYLELKKVYVSHTHLTSMKFVIGYEAITGIQEQWHTHLSAERGRQVEKR